MHNTYNKTNKMDNFDLKKYLAENKLNEVEGKTQTAIEWLEEQLDIRNKSDGMIWHFNKAKEMEKEQMKKMYEHAMWALTDTGHGEDFEEYWNKNFK
jgi:hypothetical protein